VAGLSGNAEKPYPYITSEPFILMQSSRNCRAHKSEVHTSAKTSLPSITAMDKPGTFQLSNVSVTKLSNSIANVRLSSYAHQGK
jgi:hypothetical protein